jgi:hypothetical protein
VTASGGRGRMWTLFSSESSLPEDVVLHHGPTADLVQGQAQIARPEVLGRHLGEGLRAARQDLFAAERGSSFLRVIARSGEVRSGLAPGALVLPSRMRNSR